jgi:hypothetical protein
VAGSAESQSVKALVIFKQFLHPLGVGSEHALGAFGEHGADADSTDGELFEKPRFGFE